MILGFTGTSRGAGMTSAQRSTLEELLLRLPADILHHGVCINADAQAHRIARALGVYIVGHPPSNTRKMALLAGFDELRPPAHYLKRNRNIVREALHGLIAAPRMAEEPRVRIGEGTWTTVHYARQAGRHIWIIAPDGTVREEEL